MLYQVDDALLHAMSGIELSRVQLRCEGCIRNALPSAVKLTVRLSFEPEHTPQGI
jgi:hypothetical protein